MSSKRDGVQPHKTEARFFYGYIVVIAAFSVMLVANIGMGAFGLFLKPLTTEFGWTAAKVSGAFSLAMIVYGIMGIVMGGLTDKFGPRGIITCCGLLMGIGYLLLFKLSTLWQLYLLLGVLVSMGMGGVWVPQLSTISRWFIKNRSLMTGIAVAGMGIGGLIGPIVVSRLILTYNWRLTYAIIGIVTFLVLIFAARLMRRDPAEIGQRPYGEGEEENQELKSENNDFTFRESIITVQFWTAFFIFICIGYCGAGIMVHIVSHAMELRICSLKSANILAVYGGFSILGMYVMGWVGDKTGNRQVFLISCILTTLAFLGLIFLKDEKLLILLASLSGFAFGGTGAVESPLIAWLFGLSSHGLIYGVVHIGFTIGAAIGPFTMGYLYDLNGNYVTAFLTGFIVSSISIILTILLKPITVKG
ncbi:MAG: MFS transporter [Deltaproteobacteria bacterium]|nr:MFS transporter [Deltaproteobacteria bacterium]